MPLRSIVKLLLALKASTKPKVGATPSSAASTDTARTLILGTSVNWLRSSFGIKVAPAAMSTSETR